MAKVVYASREIVNQIFDDLQTYLKFCKEYGYKYNEKDLYDNKSYAYRQFNKYTQGKTVVNNWDVELEEKA